MKPNISLRCATRLVAAFALAAASSAFAFTFSENFESQPLNGKPSHWMEAYGTPSANWTIVDDDASSATNKVYKQTATSGFQESLLHTFALNPTWEVRFKVHSTSAGKVGLYVRYNDFGSRVRLTYDFNLGQWLLSEQEESDRAGVVRATKTQALSLNAWHTARVVCSGNTVNVYIDGAATPTLGATNIAHDTYGRVGVFCDKSVVSFDNASYSSVAGRVQDGVLEYDLKYDYDANGASLMFARKANGDLLASGDGFRTSADHGKTWSIITATLPAGFGSPPQLLKLQSGKFFEIRGAVDFKTDVYAMTSTDGVTWTKRGTIRAGNFSVMPGKATQLASGRIVIIGNITFKGTAELRYSDDEGATWHLGHTFNSALYEEHQVVQLPNGQLKVFARSREDSSTFGKLAWANSTGSHNGTQWGAFSGISQLVSPLCAFAAQRDGNYIYVYWCYNNPAHETSEPAPVVKPRTRQSLARFDTTSSTWTYLLDVDDWEYPAYTNTITQDARYMNHSMFIDGTYVFMTVKRQNPYYPTTDFAQKGTNYFSLFTRVTKSKLTPYTAFPIVHYARKGIIE